MTTRTLAILGGEPAFAHPLHVGRPNIGDRDRLLGRINDLLDRRWLTNLGPYVQELETKLCQLLGVRHCIPMCNGTIALEITIRALGLRGEVIVPSYTFVATAHALQWQEITPVFCDIDPATHNLDPCRLEALLTPKTSGIIATHVWGRACPIQELEDFAARKGLTLMFDAAHALGSTYKGVAIGNFGKAEVFSFHATKFVNSFEGGAVATNDDELADRIRLMKNFGFRGYDKVVYIGTNGKMSEPCAAMALTSLEGMSDFISLNTQNHRLYAEHLRDIEGISILKFPDTERCNYQYVVAEVEPAFGLSRDMLVNVLHRENVLARRYFYPGCHRMEPYRSLFPHAHFLLPRTEEVASKVLVLPTGSAVSADAIEAIANVIREAKRRAPQLRSMLNC